MMRKILLIVLVLWSVNSSEQNINQPQRPEEQYFKGLFRSNNGYTFPVMDDPNAASYFSVFQYLQGRVPGLYSYHSGVFARPYISYRSGSPALFLDEVRVDASALASVNMNDVAFIKVFRPPFFGAFGGGANGAIAVYTLRGDDEGNDDTVNGE